MLKVVGASWLQTRISTYILVAVALLGIGAIILGEFGRVENDGTYSASVSWNRKGGYQIDFWGQGNDLSSLPLNAARAYYKTAIFQSGWSLVEIETSAKYPDAVQAYAAGLLEGSLTWQLIHHHWYNTVNVRCEKRPDRCRHLMTQLRENSDYIRERAQLRKSQEPFWHMVSLFYAQLDGLEAGFKFAVRRSRQQNVQMQSDDFLWLAMADDLTDFNDDFNMTDAQIQAKGMIFVKALARENLQPLMVFAHNTAAPYSKMLRLLKRYKFNFHHAPFPTAEPIAAKSVVMSSYPGALSSHDEFYILEGNAHDNLLLVASTPLLSTSKRNNASITKERILSSVRVMAANRLARGAESWSRMMTYEKSSLSTQRQWLSFEPRINVIWLVEQQAGTTNSLNYSKVFAEASFLSCTGASFMDINTNDWMMQESVLQKDHVTRLQKNITTLEHVRRLMRGNDQRGDNHQTDLELSQILTFRGDQESEPIPVGVIDSKILAVDVDGLETFEATSGPANSPAGTPFEWSNTFPNISHVGHPDRFRFQSVTPFWIWI
ncbi:putative phospholipase B-like lamina ancestor [Prorops nasuta]|uniref:putative phospholipase B-like lamina ancestor n=1 Tax=Prorops nasuta TaxID=863751 RepID=UPI0034CFD87C